MEISELTLKLIILLVPGAFAAIIFEKLSIHKKWNAFKFICYSIIFGLFSYTAAAIICGLPNGLDSDISNIFSNITGNTISYVAVLKGTVASFFISIGAVYIDTYKLLNRLSKLLGASTKYGDENLFMFFLNSQDVQEVFIHDIENNITYWGMIDSFSENSDLKEVVLRKVKVYSYDQAAFAYDLDRIYICRPKDKLVIEVPSL